MMSQRNAVHGGMFVAKRNRYRHMEIIMTRIILGVLAAFILYLVFSWRALNPPMVVLKLVFGIGDMVVCALSLGWLYITGEFKHRRSLWMITTFICVIICIVVSLILNFPCPPITL